MSLAPGLGLGRMQRNNTPNASRLLCAPLGVAFLCLTVLRQMVNIRRNTPAMPLHDAHFGGFFASGVC